MGRLTSVALTQCESVDVCCGKLAHGMLPGWCLYASDSNLGPALQRAVRPHLLVGKAKPLSLFGLGAGVQGNSARSAICVDVTP